ncbi:MAG: carboxymuconolactone decarboxylase family protein, partial [Candidatus Thorarchaeota archaeon]
MTLNTHYQGQRLHYRSLAKDAFEKLIEFQSIIAKSGIDELLLELIKIRASQINGCAFCVDMHIKDALLLGEKQERINMLVVWQETSLFTLKEQAALAWTEALTNIQKSHISDELYKFMKENFTEKEIAYITMGIVAINGWNRLAISFRDESGKYVARQRK